MEPEESETDEIYQIEQPQSLKRIYIQQNRENDDLVDTDIELSTNTVVEDTTKITESQLNNEGHKNVVVQYTENNQLITSESVIRQITENPDENVYTEEEMAFDYLTFPGDYIDYDILEEEK